jgi:UDP-3-O-[3-hydroxymyristoyl] glucosamine N-acyltransferase
MKMTVAQLAERIGAELVGDGSVQISGVGPVEGSRKSDVTFVKDREHYSSPSGAPAYSRHVQGLKKSEAGAAIISRRVEGVTKPQLIVENVDAALIETLKIFAPKLKAVKAGIDASAIVGRDVKIGKDVSVGSGTVIEDGAEIGTGSVIANGCRIGENSRVGEHCRLDSNVVVYHNCKIGNNVAIQANSTIGSSGFGYSFIDTKIDNLVQIAHNVEIGKCCLIAAMVGIAGSCKVGDGVVVGGQGGLADNIEVADGTIVGAHSGVTHSITTAQQLFGMPAIEKNEALRIIGLTRRLPKFAEQLRQLSKRIEGLEASEDNTERSEDIR